MNAFLLPGTSTVPWPAIRIMTVSFLPARRFKKSWKPLRTAAVVAFSSVSSRTLSGIKPPPRGLCRSWPNTLASASANCSDSSGFCVFRDSHQQSVGFASRPGGGGGCGNLARQRLLQLEDFALDPDRVGPLTRGACSTSPARWRSACDFQKSWPRRPARRDLSDWPLVQRREGPARPAHPGQFIAGGRQELRAC